MRAHLGKSHVRPEVHDPGPLWLTCVSCWHWEIPILVHPCTHLPPTLPAQNDRMDRFQSQGPPIRGGGALGPQGRVSYRRKIDPRWYKRPPPQRGRQSDILRQKQQQYPTCLLVHTVVKCPHLDFVCWLFTLQPFPPENGVGFHFWQFPPQPQI